MPYINVSTSVKVNDKVKLLEEISILISSLTNKSRRFVMAKIDDNCQMYFDDETPSCFLEIKSIGCLLYTSPSPRDVHLSRMPSSA